MPPTVEWRWTGGPACSSWTRWPSRGTPRRLARRASSTRTSPATAPRAGPTCGARARSPRPPAFPSSPRAGSARSTTSASSRRWRGWPGSSWGGPSTAARWTWRPPSPTSSRAMLCKRLIPCLDVKDGRVVKGVRFVELRDAGDPVAAALAYDAQGADELVFLDITASHEGRAIMLDVVRRTAEGIYMPLTVGGGVRTLDDIRTLLRAGADKVSLNTAALERPELVSDAARAFGSQCIVVAIDAKRGAAEGEPAVAGRGAAEGEPSEYKGEASRGKPSWQIYTHGGRRS